MKPTYDYARDFAERYARKLSDDDIISKLLDEGFSAWNLLAEVGKEKVRPHFIEREADKRWANMPRECHVCGSEDLYSPRGGTPFAFCEDCGRKNGYIKDD